MQRSAGGATGAGRDGDARHPAADRDTLAHAGRDSRADRDALAYAGRDCRADAGRDAHADAGRDCRADRDALAATDCVTGASFGPRGGVTGDGHADADGGGHARRDAIADGLPLRPLRHRPARSPSPAATPSSPDPADTTSAVTTYEALRDGTTTALLIHKSDAHGASQAALYDAVAAGDLFEWHEADDCFVRYKVTEVKPDP